MKGENPMGKKTEILTTTLETGETVLAKRERVEDHFDGTAQYQISPLRYGNETQALAKITAIRPQFVEIGHIAKVIKQGGRFLVSVCKVETTPHNDFYSETRLEIISNLQTSKLYTEEPGVQTISIDSIEEMMIARQIDKASKFISRYGQVAEDAKTAVDDYIMHNMKLASMAPSIRRKYVFATTTGKRMNPRSRHNHPTNTTDERYYYV
jgi:hypothetical protein